VGEAHRGSSAPEREILLSTELAALLKKLQLLADGIPPADPTGRASWRPNEDGARHGEPSYDEFVERWRLGMDVSVL
jgi:hypothetical protein